MIYVLTLSEVVPGKMAERTEIAGKEMVPLFPKLGMKQVASWHSITGNVNETYSLYEYKDLAEYQKVLEARNKNKAYQAASAKLNAVQVKQTTTILEPNAWSPMK